MSRPPRALLVRAAAGLRRALDARVDRVLAAGPPTRRDEQVAVVLATLVAAAGCALVWAGRALTR